MPRDLKNILVGAVAFIFIGCVFSLLTGVLWLVSRAVYYVGTLFGAYLSDGESCVAIIFVGFIVWVLWSTGNELVGS